MPALPTQRRLSSEGSLRDRRWSTIVWNALVPLPSSAQAGGMPFLYMPDVAAKCWLYIVFMLCAGLAYVAMLSRGS